MLHFPNIKHINIYHDLKNILLKIEYEKLVNLTYYNKKKLLSPDLWAFEVCTCYRFVILILRSSSSNF